MPRSFAANHNLKRLIDERLMSQSKLATAAGMRPETLSRIVNCKRPIFADEIARLCTAIGVTVDDLIRESDRAI